MNRCHFPSQLGSRVLLVWKSLAGIILTLLAGPVVAQSFVHPGLLHTEADFNRMQTKVDAGAQPWLAGWGQLTGNGYSQLGATPRAVAEVTRPGNVAQMYIDIYRCYQCAVRWKVSGDTRYADQVVRFLNAWSSTMTNLTGNADRFLAAGIHGYQWANVGEIMRTYPGWAAADVVRFQNLLLTEFYPLNHQFLTSHNGAAITNYWSNWDLCNIASTLAIGVFCDRRDIYDEALAYIYNGGGNGAIDRAVYHRHPGNLGQMQEAGRDQGHTTLSIALLGPICEMAWNQGEDVYGYANHRFLAGAEYVAKYNLFNEVPYVPYMWGNGQTGAWSIQDQISSYARGSSRPMWEMVYHHYVNRLGMQAPYSTAFAAQTRPEGNGGNGDQFGFGTLTFTRDPIAAGATPKLTLAQSGGDVVLSWWGSAYATSYHVKRATNPGGPYVTIAANVAGSLYTDRNPTAPGTYYYVITGVLPSAQETAASNEASAAFPAQMHTRLAFDETTDTTAADASGNNHVGTLLNGPLWTAGKLGNAVALDGVDDHVSLPPGIVIGLTDFTVATWVYLNDSRQWSRIFDFGGKAGVNMFLTPKASNGKTRFVLATVYTYNEARVDVPALPTGQWVHVAVSLSGEIATLYINGVQAGRNTNFFLQPSQMAPTPKNYIGRSQYSADPYLNGKVDEFRIYSYALRGDEIYSLWGQSPNAPPVFAAENISLPTATEDVDYAGSLLPLATDLDGQTLTFTKVTGPAWLTVASDGTLSGRPEDADVGENIFAINVADLSGASSLTRASIIVHNTNDAPMWPGPLTRPPVTRDQLYFSFTLAKGATDVDEGDVVSYSKTSGPLWLSIAADGTLTGTPTEAHVGDNDFIVRASDPHGGFTETTLTIQVLGPVERAHYLLDTGLVESIGGSIATSSVMPPSWLTGRIGSAMSFDGTNDGLTLPKEFSDSPDITVAAWVFWKGGNTSQRIFEFGNDDTHFFHLRPNTSTGLRASIRIGATEQQLTTTGFPAGIPSNTWVHVAVTLGGNTGTLYVNGSVAATNTSMTLNPSDMKPQSVFVGKPLVTTNARFAGRIDDFRIWNYALTANQVSTLLTLPPAVPETLLATTRPNQITLTWSMAHGATSYTLKRGLSANGPFTTLVSGLTTPAYTDTQVALTVPYFYVVNASNALGASSDSAVVSAVASDRVAWWKFDETSGNLAMDSTGNGWNATLASTPTWTPGLFNGDVSLNASSQHLTVPTGIVNGLDEITIACWFQQTATNTWQRIFDFGTGTTNYLFLTPQHSSTTPNRLRFAIKTATEPEETITSSVAWTPGLWNHVAVTISGSTGRLYLNGVLVGSNTAMTLKPSSIGASTLNYLGRSQFSADPYFIGQLDDFRIYSRSLASTEIAALASPQPASPINVVATGGGQRILLTWPAVDSATSYSIYRSDTLLASNVVAGNYTDLTASAGNSFAYRVTSVNWLGESAPSASATATATWLQVHLKLDEATGAIIAPDSSNDGFHGTVNGAPMFEAGLIGNAMLFDGLNDRITLPVGIADHTHITVAAWVWWNGGSASQRIFSFGDDTTNYLNLSPAASAGKLKFGIRFNAGTEQVLQAATALPTGSWQHVAVTLNGSNGTLYLNGNVVATNSSITLNPLDFTPNINYLGDSVNTTDPSFSGKIDDFRLYSRSLTAAEVMALTDISPYAQWQEQYFGSPAPAVANATADPDKDGLNNLVEYALGQDPRTSNPTPLRFTTTAAGSLQLGFHRITDPALHYELEVSTDLNDWPEIIWSSTDPTASQADSNVIIPIPASSASRRFFRLNISGVAN